LEKDWIFKGNNPGASSWKNKIKMESNGAPTSQVSRADVDAYCVRLQKEISS
jgi:hypothetical protein